MAEAGGRRDLGNHGIITLAQKNPGSEPLGFGALLSAGANYLISDACMP